MDQTKLFNSALTDFVKELRKAFPADASIKACKRKLKATLSTAPTLVHALFRSHLYPFHELVSSRDHSFFTGDARDILKRSLQIDLEDIMNKCDDGMKDIVWQYLSILMQLSDESQGGATSSQVIPHGMDLQGALANLPQGMDLEGMLANLPQGLDLEGMLANLPQGMSTESLPHILSSMAKSIDPSVIESVASQIDPSCAGQMKEMLASGDLEKHLGEAMAQIDPSIMDAAQKVLSGEQNMETLIEKVSGSLPPEAMAAVAGMIGGATSQ